MKVTAKFVANNQNIKALVQAQKRALARTGEALRTEVIAMQVVPKHKGILEADNSFIDESELDKLVVSLVYDTPYARRQYYGLTEEGVPFNYRTDKNPNAQSRWLEPFITGDKKDWVKNTFMEFFRQEAKGLIK